MARAVAETAIALSLTGAAAPLSSASALSTWASICTIRSGATIALLATLQYVSSCTGLMRFKLRPVFLHRLTQAMGDEGVLLAQVGTDHQYLL